MANSEIVVMVPMSVGFIPGDVPRVNGQLAVARAFGDQSLKAHLSSEPDVRHVPIDPTIEFVILASDGLWKVSDFIRSCIDIKLLVYSLNM